jgi:ABC-type glutathione transport system ATPase component
MPPVLQLRDLDIDLDGAPLVSGVSFELHPGTITGLYGDSGCGKTTLALALMRLLAEDRYRVRGSIQLNGRNVLSRSVRELESMRGAEISMIFQDPLLALNPVMRVRTQVEEVLRAHRKNGSAAELFELVGLPSDARILNAYPHQLSGGERQRVTIAQALACRPQVVIADEPFTALDVIRIVELAALFRKLLVDTGVAFLLISHNPAVLKALAGTVLQMERGQVCRAA